MPALVHLASLSTLNSPSETGRTVSAEDRNSEVVFGCVRHLTEPQHRTAYNRLCCIAALTDFSDPM
jgi:hypothetical protein